MSPIITFDVDWAPDAAIDFTANYLCELNIKSTWFITHLSPAINRLKDRPSLFEIGIHPNFMPTSSHGDTPTQVLDFCMNLAPNAKSMRTHCLYQSSPLIDLILETTPIENDVSLFMPLTKNIRPFNYHRHQKTLCRFPYFWEDGYIFGLPNNDWASQIHALENHATIESKDDLKIFNFHPIHILLNSKSDGQYNLLKDKHPDLGNISEEEAVNYANQRSLGARDYFLKLLSFMNDNHKGGFIDDLSKTYALK